MPGLRPPPGCDRGAFPAHGPRDRSVRGLSAITIPGWVHDRARYQPEGVVVASPDTHPELRTE